MPTIVPARHASLIAQDVEKVLPELVHTDSDGYKSLSYDKLTAVLVEGMKEQQKQIEALRAENRQLAESVERLAQKVAERSAQ